MVVHLQAAAAMDQEEAAIILPGVLPVVEAVLLPAAEGRPAVMAEVHLPLLTAEMLPAEVHLTAEVHLPLLMAEVLPAEAGQEILLHKVHPAVEDQASVDVAVVNHPAANLPTVKSNRQKLK